MSMKMYKIGHSAYSGANSLALAASRQSAIAILRSRGVPLDKACEALDADYATVRVYGTFDVIEVQRG